MSLHLVTGRRAPERSSRRTPHLLAHFAHDAVYFALLLGFMACAGWLAGRASHPLVSEAPWIRMLLIWLAGTGGLAAVSVAVVSGAQALDQRLRRKRRSGTAALGFSPPAVGAAEERLDEAPVRRGSRAARIAAETFGTAVTLLALALVQVPDHPLAVRPFFAFLDAQWSWYIPALVAVSTASAVVGSPLRRLRTGRPTRANPHVS